MASDDGRAWMQALLDRNEGPLLRYAARITGSDELAREVVQDTFCRLCAQPRAKVAGHEVEWLYTVCRNRALDVRRKEGRTMVRSTSDDALLDRQASPAPAPTAVVERGETVSRVLALLDTLPENQREVVRLKFQGGLSYKEISRVTELSVSNVGYLLHTALKTLRARLSKPGLAPSA
jgi:RNA polymerase sigma-70 factor (ECF subfamily)